MAAQLGRELRGVVEVAHRCKCGKPDVVKTLPRLEDGTPFPTLYYITCPRLSGLIGQLEANGAMRAYEDELKLNSVLADQYQLAHEQYLADRAQLGDVQEIAGVSAGGMPTRVKCLHVLVGHALAKGPGVNPIGDAVLQRLSDWSAKGCEQEE